MRKRSIVLFVALSPALCAAVLVGARHGVPLQTAPGHLGAGEELSFPQSTPEQEGFSQIKLEALKDSLAARHTTSLLIVRHDKIVYEWYAPGWGPARPHGTASLAKALVGGMSLLVALNDGWIAADDLASRYIPDWKHDPQKSKITIRQLATHSSGIEDAEEGDIGHMQLPGWKGAFWKRTPDPFSIAIHDAPVIFPPGTSFAYSNPGMAALAYAVTASLRDAPQTDIRTLLEERIMDPLGIPESNWSIGYGRPYAVDGLNLYANWGGAQFTPRAAARVGQLMLHEGMWQGRQLVGREWVKKMVAGFGPAPLMGLCWWINATGAWPKAPRDAFLGSGAGDQMVFIVPSLDLIVVRNGAWLDQDNEYNHNYQAQYVYGPVMDALIPQSPPYSPSQLIRSVSFDWKTHQRHAPGSDNWPATWADDGHLYGSWGDGGGFGGTDLVGRVSLGVARVEGPWNDYHGFNVWGGKSAEHPATFRGKSYGMICVDGTLYMWVITQLEGDGTPRYKAATRLFQSKDHGATWTPANWSFTRGEGVDNAPTICQFGRDYAGARDQYVYHYFVRPRLPAGFAAQKPGAIDLARVPKTCLMDRSAYEFFAGLDGERRPLWTRDVTAKKPVFEDANGVGFSVSVNCNAGLQRYILMTGHTEVPKGNLGIFEGPEPWGPWRTVLYLNDTEGKAFGAGLVEPNTFYWNMPTKWQSPEGTEFTLVFTGGFVGRRSTNDSFNTVRGHFDLAR